MTTTAIIIIAAIYALGGVAAYKMMADWQQPAAVKILWSTVWPLIGLLFIVNLLHNKL
jgi:hypothetical protein